MVKDSFVTSNGIQTSELTKLKCITKGKVILFNHRYRSVVSILTCLHTLIVRDLVGDVASVVSARDDLHGRDSDIKPSQTILKVAGVNFILKFIRQTRATH